MTPTAPPAIRRRLRRGICLLFALLTVAGGAAAADPAAFTMGTDIDDTTQSGRWMRKIYDEAFRRLDIPLKVAIFPTKRLSTAVDAGDVDGEFFRVYEYAAAHPNLVRVEVPVMEVVFALFTADPALRLNRIEDLPASGLSGDYRRGVLVCETTLKQWLPADRLSDVNTTEQGLKKLIAKRSDFMCDMDTAVASVLLTPDFKHADAIRRLAEIKTLSLYPYVHRRNADLAPRLAATLKKMRAEGLIERYRQESEREVGFAR